MASVMRIAVLADVHGNAPALRAVLAEIDEAGVDAIVVAGDVVGGPQPREALELLVVRPEPVTWIAGNAEHEALAVLAGRRRCPLLPRLAHARRRGADPGDARRRPARCARGRR
jgi:predicted phosphodiesterase